MFKRLRLSRFKSFEDAELDIGPLTVLLGTNASGKSNIRDAFRFLHGIGLGYPLPEIFGQAWRGGEKQWDGIRGGSREATYFGASSFALEVVLDIDGKEVTYSIEVQTDRGSGPPRIKHTAGLSASVIKHFAEMRFFDFIPQAMRQPAQVGQTSLSDHGENLAAVLQALCTDPRQKQDLIAWLHELTPLDVKDLEFQPDPANNVHLILVDARGNKSSAYSASDGTLRFLALAAVLLGREPVGLSFFEELENGIHPTRLHLVLQLIEQQVAKGKMQVMATTHSPLLLGLLNETSRQHASVVYRLPHHPETRIRRVVDVPDVAQALKQRDLARLHASGWFEDAAFFTDEDDPAEEQSA